MQNDRRRVLRISSLHGTKQCIVWRARVHAQLFPLRRQFFFFSASQRTVPTGNVTPGCSVLVTGCPSVDADLTSAPKEVKFTKVEVRLASSTFSTPMAAENCRKTMMPAAQLHASGLRKAHQFDANYCSHTASAHLLQPRAEVGTREKKKRKKTKNYPRDYVHNFYGGTRANELSRAELEERRS